MISEPDNCPLQTTSTPWLNMDFLEKVLKSCNKTPTLTITKYDVKPAVDKGDNYASDLYRVKIYTADRNVFSLIVKRELCAGGEFGQMMRKSTVFKRETLMYRTVASKLASILQETMPGKCAQLTARYYYSCPGTIVVQDLCAEGFKMAQRRQGLDYSHCLLVMHTLARFHAASVVLHDRDPESMSLYNQNFFSEPAARKGFQNFVSGSLRSVATAVQTWPGFAERYADKLSALADSLMDRIIQAVSRDNSAFNVLIHGDLWVNNMLFRYRSSGDPDEIRFLDFQFLHFSSPAIDLQYFFNTSPCEDVRAEHLEDLMKEYHSTLCDTLDALGYSHKRITLEDLWKEYDNKVLYGVFGACCVLPVVLAETGVDLDAAFESRGGQQCDAYNGDIYKTALQRMLPIFEEKGAFRS